jgi:hypothetical protein
MTLHLHDHEQNPFLFQNPDYTECCSEIKHMPCGMHASVVLYYYKILVTKSMGKDNLVDLSTDRRIKLI